MNRQPIPDSWAFGELFGVSEQFARGRIELSGISGWFALAPAAQILPRGDRPRHATSELADATDELSRRPSQLSRRPAGLAGLTGESAGLTGHPAGPPGELAGRPGQLSRRPAESDGRPSEPDGPGAVRGEGMDGARKPGVRALARAVFVPEGRRRVATGGAQGRRPERNPWTGTERWISAPAGRRSFAGCASAPVDACFLCPSGAGENRNDDFHGLRALEDSLTPPVATGRDPSGVENGARVLAVDVSFRAGEVPEGRHAPLASADQHAVGSGVRRG